MLLRRTKTPAQPVRVEYSLGQTVMHAKFGAVTINCKSYFRGGPPMYFFTARDGKTSCARHDQLQLIVGPSPHIRRRVRR